MTCVAKGIVSRDEYGNRTIPQLQCLVMIGAFKICLHIGCDCGLSINLSVNCNKVIGAIKGKKDCLSKVG